MIPLPRTRSSARGLAAEFFGDVSIVVGKASEEPSHGGGPDFCMGSLARQHVERSLQSAIAALPIMRRKRRSRLLADCTDAAGVLGARLLVDLACGV